MNLWFAYRLIEKPRAIYRKPCDQNADFGATS